MGPSTAFDYYAAGIEATRWLPQQGTPTEVQFLKARSTSGSDVSTAGDGVTGTKFPTLYHKVSYV